MQLPLTSGGWFSSELRCGHPEPEGLVAVIMMLLAFSAAAWMKDGRWMPMAPRAATMSALAPASSKLSLVKKVAVGPLCPSLLLKPSRTDTRSPVFLHRLSTSGAPCRTCASCSASSRAWGSRARYLIGMGSSRSGRLLACVWTTPGGSQSSWSGASPDGRADLLYCSNSAYTFLGAAAGAA